MDSDSDSFDITDYAVKNVNIPEVFAESPDMHLTESTGESIDLISNNTGIYENQPVNLNEDYSENRHYADPPTPNLPSEINLNAREDLKEIRMNSGFSIIEHSNPPQFLNEPQHQQLNLIPDLITPSNPIRSNPRINNLKPNDWSCIYLKKSKCQICESLFNFESYSQNLSCSHLCLVCLNIFTNLGGRDCPLCHKFLKVIKVNLTCTACNTPNCLSGAFLCKNCFYCDRCCFNAYKNKRCRHCLSEFDEVSKRNIMAIGKIKRMLENR